MSMKKMEKDHHSAASASDQRGSTPLARDQPKPHASASSSRRRSATEARGVVRAVAEAQRRKNGTVDKRQFLGDFDKEHLLGKTFGGGGDAGRR